MADKQGTETSFELSYHQLGAGVDRLLLSGWTCLIVSGGDAGDWLQGQLSNDVARLGPGEAIRAALLSPTGQMTADVVLCREEGNYFLLLERQLLSTVQERLNRFLIAEDVTLEANGDQIDLDIGYSLGARAEFQWVCGDEKFSARLMDDKHEPYDESPALYNLLTLEKHWPLFEKDYTHSTLAMELGDKFIQSRISFDKGCYVGQEVVHRIYARGHTNKTWVVLKTPTVLDPGATLRSAEGERVGYVTRSATSPKHGPIAGVWLPNAYLQSGAQLTCGSTSFQAQPLD
ncbi:MAG: hypothetical protein U0R49_01880 [Fimbriimonadales bacterium]